MAPKGLAGPALPPPSMIRPRCLPAAGAPAAHLGSGGSHRCGRPPAAGAHPLQAAQHRGSPAGRSLPAPQAAPAGPSQSGWGGKGPPQVPWPEPPAEAGPPRAGCPAGPAPGRPGGHSRVRVRRATFAVRFWAAAPQPEKLRVSDCIWLVLWHNLYDRNQHFLTAACWLLFNERKGWKHVGSELNRWCSL